MIDKRTTTRRYNWSETPREKVETRWTRHYATLTPKGKITISRFTHEAMGDPDSYRLLYDADRNVVGLAPARLNVTKNAYPANIHGKTGARRIFAGRMMREHGLYLAETALFPRCFIDSSGMLILELNDVKPARRKKSKYGY